MYVSIPLYANIQKYLENNEKQTVVYHQSLAYEIKKSRKDDTLLQFFFINRQFNDIIIETVCWPEVLYTSCFEGTCPKQCLQMLRPQEGVLRESSDQSSLLLDTVKGPTHLK